MTTTAHGDISIIKIVNIVLIVDIMAAFCVYNVIKLIMFGY